MARTTKKQRIIEALNCILEEAHVTRTHDKVCILAYNIACDVGGINLYDIRGNIFFGYQKECVDEFHRTGTVTKPAHVDLRF